MKKIIQSKNTTAISNKIIDEQTSFSVAEAYRNLRTNLFFSVPGKNKCKKIIFTSSVTTEGKTTTCTNLALTISQTDSKVLLVDCDLRKPRIERYLSIKTEKGLSDYLCGQCSAEAIIYKTKYKNLSIIPSGLIPPNPSELLSRKELSELLSEIEKDYDYILFDTPPLDNVSDALILVPYCEGVVLVVKNNLTTHPTLQKTIKKLEFANAKILGFVINGVQNSNLYGNYYSYQREK